MTQVTTMIWRQTRGQTLAIGTLQCNTFALAGDLLKQNDFIQVKYVL